MAWPRQGVLSGMRVGDHVKLVPVGKAQTGADGRFLLRVDPSAPIAEAMTADGIVNFEVLATSGRSTSVFSFPRRLSTVDGTPAWVDVGGGAAAPVRLTVGGPGSLETSDDANAPIPASYKFCNSYFVSAYDPVWGVVAEQYSGPNATSDFAYSSGSSSTEGVGISASGNFGTFSASGTSTIGSTATIDFATQPQNARWVQKTQFRYAKYRIECMNPPDTWYEARPYQWIGGSSGYTAGGTPTASYCTPYNANDAPSIDQHDAITFSNGVSMSGPIGIDLSNKTGFTTTAKLKFVFVNSGNLCGSNDYPFQAYRVVGK